MSAQTPVPSREVRAEAAAWLARLHAEDRDSADEAAFRTWLNADPSHALAFEAVDRTWSDVGGSSSLKTVRTDLRLGLGREPVRESAQVSRRLLVAGVGLLAVTGGSTM